MFVTDVAFVNGHKILSLLLRTKLGTEAFVNQDGTVLSSFFLQYWELNLESLVFVLIMKARFLSFSSSFLSFLSFVHLSH